jgi:alkanesulfonate monooxygenase SsuD/methylene tetrahydromethanopterin reductase-like flavin-dependent oxidoreductase (luciferase family)
MVDYRRPIEFGVFPVPEAGSLDEVLDACREADRLGLDLIGIQDHPYQRRFLDTFTLLSWVTAVTERVRVFPDVACLPLRPPAVLAKAAASIDLLSDGRFEMGLGAGAFWDAIDAYGGPRLAPGEARRSLEEAIEVLWRIWSGERGIRMDGDHYRLHGAQGGPVPAHRIEVWLGVQGPRMLHMLGTKADGWVPSLPRVSLDDLDRGHEIIDRAATEAGRDPKRIRRLLNVNGTITEEASDGFLTGPPGQWVEQLTALAIDHGIDSFILWPEGDLIEQVRRFSELTEEVRASVARERTAG